MTKRIFTLALLIATTFQVNAIKPIRQWFPGISRQSQWREALSARDGWFISTGVGAQYYIAEYNFRYEAHVGYGFSTDMEAHVGKWITPLFATRATFQMNRITTGYSGYNKHTQEYVSTKGGFNMVHGDIGLIIDGGYLIRAKKTRYTLNPLIAVGYAINTDSHEKGFTFTGGLINSWRVSDHVDLNIEGKVRILQDNLNGMKGGGIDGELILNAGFTYNF